MIREQSATAPPRVLRFRKTQESAHSHRVALLSARPAHVVRVSAVKIAVCVKQVPDADRPQAARPGDEAARPLGRERAQPDGRQRRRGGAPPQGGASEGEVVVVSLGPEKAMESLRKALAMGADRAVLVSDTAAAGSDLVATSYALAEGARARGGRSRPLRPAVERRRRRRALGGRRRPAPAADGLAGRGADARRTAAITGKRQTEFGYDVIAAPLPAVVAVSDAINEPRYPSLKGIMGAKSKPQEVVSLADVGVEAERVGEAGSRTTVLRSSAPPPPKSGQVQDRGRRQRAPRRSSSTSPRSGSFERRSSSSSTTTASSRRAGSACSRRRRARRRRRRRRARERCRDAAAKAGPFGAATVYVVDDERSRRRCRSRASTRSRPSSARAAPTTSSSPRRCWRPTSRPALAARLDAGLNWDLTDLALEGGDARRRASGARRHRPRRRGLDVDAAARADPLRHVRPDRVRRLGRA